MIYLQQPLRINDLIAFRTDPHLAAIVQPTHPDPGRVHALSTHQHDVGRMNGGLGFDNPALPILRTGPGMSFDEIDVLNENPVPLMVDLEHLTDLAIVFSSDDFYLVIFTDVTCLLFQHLYSLHRGRDPKKIK
jgi:hypothetical protein